MHPSTLLSATCAALIFASPCTSEAQILKIEEGGDMPALSASVAMAGSWNMTSIEVPSSAVMGWGTETDPYHGVPYLYISRTTATPSPMSDIRVLIAHPSGARYEVTAAPALAADGSHWDLRFHKVADENAVAGLSTFRTAEPFAHGEQLEFRVSIDGSPDFNQVNINHSDIDGSGGGDQASLSAEGIVPTLKGAVPLGYRRWIGDAALRQLSVSAFFHMQRRQTVSWSKESSECSDTPFIVGATAKPADNGPEYQWMQKVIFPPKGCSLFTMPVLPGNAGRKYAFQLDSTQR